jgi:hypothetical protein
MVLQNGTFGLANCFSNVCSLIAFSYDTIEGAEMAKILFGNISEYIKY